MNKMKRLFSFLLAVTMLVGGLSSVVSPAYAADKVEETKILKEVPKDVIGTTHEKAIRRLVAFGIVGGYPDGTYKPEENVTRSQFAKIVVEALGLADAVPAAQGKKTGFKDVDQYVHWASGYIAVAAGEGLIKGYEDGLFRPEEPVSYAEALTMLVRALGYQDNFLAGQWPGNYVAKAASVGITRGVKIPSDAGVTATRGYVADLVNNTLDAKVVRVNKYNPTIGQIEYEETDETLLYNKLDISKHENTRVYADKLVDDGLRKNEVKVRFLEDTRNDDEVRKSYKEGNTSTFESEFNVRTLIGEEVTTYLTDKDVLVYVERENDDKANFDYVEETDNKEVSLVKFDKTYKFDDKADVYVFDSSDDEFKYELGEDLNKDDIQEMLAKPGKFVVRNNKIVYAEVLDSTEAAPWMLVLKNDKGQLEGINKTSEDFKLDLREDRNYDYTLVYDTEGNKLSVEDIEEGNLIYAQFQDYDGDDVAVVTVVKNNEVTGKLGKYRTDRVEIEGKTYKAVKYSDSGKKFDAYYTLEKDLSDIKKWEENEDLENDFDDAYGEEVTAYLDATGKIAFLHAGAGKSSSGYKFGVVTRTYADGDRVRIFTSIDGKEGKDQVFKADKERNLTSPIVLDRDGKEVEDGKVETILGKAVKFRLNRDNEIDEDEFYVMEKDALWTMDADFGKDTMRLVEVDSVDGKVKDGAKTKSFAVDNNVLMISADKLNPGKIETELGKKANGDIEVLDTNIDIDDFDLVKWEDMKEDNKDQELRFYVFPKKNRSDEAEGVVFIGDKGANTGSDEVAVYVIKKDRKSDEVEVQFEEYGKDKDRKIVDGPKYLNHVEIERAYVAKHKSNGELELKDYKDEKNGLRNNVQSRTKYEDFVVYRNVKVLETGSQFKVEYTEDGSVVTKTFVYRNSPVTYFEDKVKDARVGDIVDLVVEDDVRVRVVGIRKEAKDAGKEETTKPGIKDGGYITYINKDASAIKIDNTTFDIDDKTEILNADGSILAMGSEEILEAKDSIKDNKVTDVKSKDGKLISVRLVGTTAELETLKWNETAIDEIENRNNVKVPYSTKEVPTVKATAKNKAEVKITQAKDFEKNNVAKIVVTSEDGEITKEYTVIFIKEEASKDVGLKSVTVNKVIDVVVSDSMEVELPAGTTEVPTVEAVANDQKAEVKITQAKDLEENNVAKIVVTAEDGEITKEYTVKFAVKAK